MTVTPKMKKIAAGALIYALIFAVLRLFVDPSGSDAALMDHFQRHRGDFERLRQMAIADGLKRRIGADYVDDKRLPPERVEEYRRLMKELGITILSVSSDKQMGFMMKEWGNFFVGGGGKAIVYYPNPPKIPIARSLDRSCLSVLSRIPGSISDQTACTAVRPMEDNWWLYRADSL